VNFFEIDHPATARLKTKGVAAMGQRANLHFVSEDLGQKQLVDVLHGTPIWDLTAPTVIVAEGLLMYLPPEAVGKLFEQCAAVTGAGSRVAFTYVGALADGRPDVGPWTWLVTWFLKLSGEPWLWGIRPEALGPFLRENRWTIAPDQMDSSGRYGVEFFGVAIK
jgi:methyltransferase (TIGR00027 family)